jgi:uracil-DNA glycosylase
MDILEEWLDLLPWFESDQYNDILVQLADAGSDTVPAPEDILNAFSYTPVDQVRVVILGTCPYSDPELAHGLSYSIPEGVEEFPPTLLNIYTELQLDYGSTPSNGSLTGWAEQDVMLLNCSLTSAPVCDWNELIDETIWLIGQETKNTVFILVGSDAMGKRGLISSRNHLILPVADPLITGSFFGTRVFSQTNQYLSQHDRGTIDWFK